MKRYICIHGHFYQPPRENPWLEEVELQDSAAPFHDWNERIAAECYGPNAASRILDSEGRIIDIVNNYSRISFNFGPTLLSWMQRKQPEIHREIVEADRLSMERYSGHGSALAQVYNHMITPLASRRDKSTQILWGIEDFKSRFGRDPEGMWLPETAVDLETLDILAGAGIRFVILAPRQAHKVRNMESNEPWRDVSNGRIDPTTAYLCRLPSGGSINLFFYDGPISQDLAFGELLKNGSFFKNRLMAAFSDNDRHWPQLVHVAVDGETFGHHHLQGEMALSYCLHLAEEDPSVALTNYGEYLERHPPVFEVEIFENSSWSCIHGLERWRTDCGCNSGGHPGWKQDWREPLRNAMNWLRDRAAQVFEELGPRYYKNHWHARDRYIELILDRSYENVNRFLGEHASGASSPEDVVNALKLLEMQRFAQYIFTSCGWFFDEISGIETVQIIQYAVRTIQLAEELSGQFFEEEFIRLLKRAPSNVLGDGGQVYEEYAKPAKVDMLRVGAHFAMSSVFHESMDAEEFSCFSVSADTYNRLEAGRSRLVTGKGRLTSNITRAFINFQFAVLWPGDHNLTCGLNYLHSFENYRKMEGDLQAVFNRGDLAEGIRLMDSYFNKSTFSIWHLFKDEQRKVVHALLEPSYQAAEASYRQILASNYTVLNFLQWLHIPAPNLFRDAAQYVVNTDIQRLFSEDELDEERLEILAEDAKRWSLRLDDRTLRFIAAEWISRKMGNLEETPEQTQLLKEIRNVLGQIQNLSLGLHLWKAENVYFRMACGMFQQMKERAASGDPAAMDWVEHFTVLGELLKINVT